MGPKGGWAALDPSEMVFPYGSPSVLGEECQLFWVFGLKRMASWGVGMCVFKGGGGSADLLVTW